jgi:tRNA(fMet)-specific endonuclease VapC
MAELYLFDTNILVHIVRSDETGQQIKAKYKPFSLDPKPRFCVVSEGEIRSLALQFSWGGQKLGQMEFALAHFGRLTIEKPEVMNAYAILEAYSKAQGVTMGKNDLWIAATAFASASRLVTTDGDFDHLASAFIAVDKIELR